MGMKGKSYKEALARLGLSQNKAAIFLGFSTRQSRRVAKGEAELSQGESMLLEVMLHMGLSVELVNKTAGIEPPAKAKKKAAKA